MQMPGAHQEHKEAQRKLRQTDTAGSEQGGLLEEKTIKDLEGLMDAKVLIKNNYMVHFLKTRSAWILALFILPLALLENLVPELQLGCEFCAERQSVPFWHNRN